MRFSDGNYRKRADVAVQAARFRRRYRRYEFRLFKKIGHVECQILKNLFNVK